MNERDKAYVVAKLEDFFPTIHSSTFDIQETLKALERVSQEDSALKIPIALQMAALTYLSEAQGRERMIGETIELAETGYQHCENPRCVINFVLDCIRAALAKTEGRKS